MKLPQDEHERTCFVMMPYEKRKVDGATVDFDDIYSSIFKPAIQRVRVQGNRRLIARRSDQAAQARLLLHCMFRDLLQSRLGLADLTGHNPNVLYELGVRQGLLGSGTVVVRMAGVQIPFDLAHVAVTPYKNRPPSDAAASVSAIAKVLRATLRYNEVDSPVYAQAREFVRRMGTPQEPTEFGRAVITAEQSALAGDVLTADKTYRQALQLEPSLALVHQRRGTLLLRDHKLEALQAFREARAAGLPEHLRTSLLEPIRIPTEIADMVKSSIPLAPKAVFDISKLIKKSAFPPQDHIQVEILPLRGMAGSAVQVISPVSWDATGVVCQVLHGSGKVADKGRIDFPELGQVARRYEVAEAAPSLADNIAGGLKNMEFSGAKVDVKIGQGGGIGGFGGFGDKGGGFGG
jgi:hypothetical protein